MKYQIQLKNVGKSYGNTNAIHNINLTIKPATIHALLGENGAGKTTLLKIIYGLVAKDTGEIFWQGKKTEIQSPNDARNLGIGMVFQQFTLFDGLTVLENLALALNFKKNLKQLKSDILKICHQFRINSSFHTLIADLSAGEKQKLEIVRCLLQSPKLLILDEPTSVLTQDEIKELFSTLFELQKQGCAILFVTHKLNEAKILCKNATIIRQGKLITHCDLTATSAKAIANIMVGQTINKYSPKKTKINQQLVLETIIKTKNPKSDKLSSYKLQLKTNTITGIAGIAGNGQDQLMSLLAGVTSEKNSLVYYRGKEISHWSVQQRNQAGIMFVPTERLGRSLVGHLPLWQNSLLGMSQYSRFVTKYLINKNNAIKFTRDIIKKFNITATDSHALASSLSGGNIQKFVVGRAILQNPQILLISNPTWGVDFNSSIYIRNELLKLRNSGMTILVCSEDLEELFTICDEIAVMKDGYLSATRDICQTNFEEVALLMTNIS